MEKKNREKQEDYIRLFRIEKNEDNFRAVQYDAEELDISLTSNWEVR